MYALLDDVDSDDEDDKENLMNDSDTEFIAEEEITQAANTQDTSLTPPEANLHVVPNDNQSTKKEKNNNNKKKTMEVDQKSKSYQARRVSPGARNSAQSK